VITSERGFELLIDAVVDYAIYLIDLEGRVSSWNAGAARIKGYTADEIIGRPFSDFFTEEDRTRGKPWRILETARQEGRAEDEGWRVRKDGSRFWAMAVLDAVRDESGQVIGFAKITRDITERREAAETLSRTREALHQAQKMEALGQLVGGIAHDFNNMLTAITNSLEPVRDGLLPEDQHRERVERALQAARGGAELVQRLLVFARKQPLVRTAIDAQAAIAEMLPLLERSCPESMRLEIKASPGLPLMVADETQLQVAMLNLVVNARDAMANGGTIRIEAEAVDVSESRLDMIPGRYVCLSVVDSGSGMTPDVLQHIFEPFFTTKEIGKGTGLGLSQVYGFVTELGGAVVAESEPGRGTRMRLYFPTRTRELSKPAEPARGEVQAAALPASVLLVEDDPLVALSTAQMLSDWGYSVVQAYDAEDALSALDAHPETSLMITDVGLPGMNGHDLVRAARGRRPELKALFVSGYDGSTMIGRTPADLRTGYLAKPYRPQELAREVRRLVNAEASAA
jgi:PAS domain S-box-containing protein